MSARFLRRAWPRVRLGIGLGCLAAFLGSLLFSLVAVAPWYDALVGFSVPWRPGYESWLGFGVYVVWAEVMAFAFAAIPGALGGAVIGLVLHNEAHGANSLGAPGVLVGGSVGGFAVAVILLALYALAGIPPWEPGSLWNPYLPWCIAIATGAWVGRRLEHYEERRHPSEPDGWRTGATDRTRS